MESKKRLLFWISGIVAGCVVLSGVFFGGYFVGTNHPKTILVKGISNLDGSATTNADFGVFWQAWQDINDDYLRNTSTTDQQKVYGAVAGLVQSLGDPYSEFFSPQDSKEFEEDVNGNFGGIGAELGEKQGQLVIIAPLKDTPASRAGILAGDAILAVNGSSTDGMLIDDSVSRIRGPVGTSVTLSIFRDGWDKPKDFKLTREEITSPTVDFSMKPGNIAYVALHQFNANADDQFYNAIKQAADQNAAGLVLDLRDDPGGFLDVAVDIAGWFLPKGTLVVKEQDKDGKGPEYKADGNEALKDIPTVVLINGGSASASEILAGALRDDRHIELVGEKSFGKGTVQTVENLKDGSSLKITIAHWVLPSGKIIDGQGLEPDIAVKPSDDPKQDPQLDKALEVLSTEMAK